jgi:glutathionyl-hydroquinone reductase
MSSGFRNWISSLPGSRFPPEANRYHLYVSLACPFAHRTLLGRGLKGLEDVISISIVDTFLGDEGLLPVNTMLS